ncbi:MAG: protein kinase [Proteobacteria bacterium]|nr:protein kinase [Pseudomonadota bacterium]
MEPLGFAGTERFQILAEIGRGGMGTVYKAIDREAESTVALKVLNSYSPEALLRFKREFRALAGIEHPNLVMLGELGEVDGSWFFTMELIDGVDFIEYLSMTARKNAGRKSSIGPSGTRGGRRRVRQVGRGLGDRASDLLSRLDESGARFDEQFLRSVLLQVVRGLDALHRVRKIHRDIKPANVLVTFDGRAVILDFGLVADRDRPDPHSRQHIVGTIAYMAPEQLLSGRATPATDFYAMGIMLYQALTGRLPFLGTLIEQVTAKQENIVRPPSELARGIPEDLDALCVALLHRDAAERPGAEEILQRLGAGHSESVLAASTERTASPGDMELFIGRRAQLQVLLSAMQPDNLPFTCVIRAASGVGKSALARRFIELAGPDILLLDGRCYERENVPFKGVDGVIDALAHHLVDLSDDEVTELLPDSAPLLIFPFPILRRIEALRAADVWHSARVQDRRERVFVALRQLFARLAERHRLIVLIDDMQWAGADTWMLVRQLVQPPAAPGLLLVLLTRPFGAPSAEHLGRATERENDQSDQNGQNDRDDQTDRKSDRAAGPYDPFDVIPGRKELVDLDVLPADEAVELTRALLEQHRASRCQTESTATEPTATQSVSEGDVLDAISRQLARESGGHPLFIRELVDHVTEVGVDATRETRLEEALIARIRRLPPPSRQLVQLIAVAGIPVQQSIMARAADLDFTAYTRVVTPLRQARLVYSPGVHPSDPIEHYHDRVRESVLSYMPPDQRKKLHRRLVEVFEERGVFEHNPEVAVHHLSASGDDARAAHYAEIAGKRAINALAFDQAARLYQTALELGEHDAAAVLRLTLARAEALVDGGRNTEAAALYSGAAEMTADADVRHDCQRRAAEQLLFSGDIDQGVRTLEQVLAPLGVRLAATPKRALLSLLWQRARLRLRGLGFTERSESEIAPDQWVRLDVYKTVTMGLGMVDNIRAADFQSRHLRLALELGEPTRLLHALSFETWFLASQMSARSRHLAALTVELAERKGGPIARAYARFAHSGVYYFVDNDWASARQCLLESERLLREHAQSAGFETDTLGVFRCFCSLQLGDLIDLAHSVPAYIDQAVRRGVHYVQVSLRSRLILPWLAAGDPDRAADELERAFAAWVPWSERFSVQHFYGLHSLCELALYRDQPDAGTAHMAEQWDALRSSHLLRIPLVRAEIDYARARLAIARAIGQKPADRAGNVRRARAIARRLARNRAPLARALCSLVRAAIARANGDDERAIAALDKAIAVLDAMKQHLLLYTARHHRAGLIGGEQSKSERDAALAWLNQQNVVKPETLCRMLLPGFE